MLFHVFQERNDFLAIYIRADIQFLVQAFLDAIKLVCRELFIIVIKIPFEKVLKSKVSIILVILSDMSVDQFMVV